MKGNMSENKLKRIKITSTNNRPYYVESNTYVFPIPDTKYLKELRKYILTKGFSLKEKSEMKFILKSLAWVTTQWKHDGMNQPQKNARALEILKSVHKESKRYRCVEYGLVLSEVLQAFGFITRKIALRSNDVAYGGYGQGHVAMELWVNDLNKWIFLDPQFGSYLVKNGNNTPLSYYEIYEEKRKKNWSLINAKFVVKPPKSEKNTEKQYKNFLKNYFGHITVSSGAKNSSISLSLEDNESVITFQGHPSDKAIFTKNQNTLYPSINRVSIFLEFKNKIKNFQKIVKDHNIKSNDDYLRKMYLFSAKPEFYVTFQNNIPLFSHYEYRHKKAGMWIRVNKKKILWNALKSNNRIEARGVNQFGRPGPLTYIDLQYL